MKITGRKKARKGVESQWRTRAMRRFLTVRAAICRGSKAMSRIRSVYGLISLPTERICSTRYLHFQPEMGAWLDGCLLVMLYAKTQRVATAFNDKSWTGPAGLGIVINKRQMRWEYYYQSSILNTLLSRADEFNL